MSDSTHHDVICGCSRRDVLTGTMLAAASAMMVRMADAQAAVGGGMAAVRPIENAIPYGAVPLPLAAVRLTGGPLKKAQELDAAYLLSLDPDRMMYYMRQLAGLQPKGAQGYGSWDGPGRNLTGHIAGHHLSAISYMYAATGDARFKQRADYMVDELAAVQQARGNGYVGALMGGGGRGGGQPVDGVQLFEQLSQGQIRSSGFDLNGMWSPWYVEHKIFAGLRDAYRQVGNRKALDVSMRFAAWVEGILAPLNEQQLQRMLGTEFGGINESLADLYADTGDARWIRLAAKFEHYAIVHPLAQYQDILGGKHGNTQVPKLLGELARYIYTGHKLSGDAARFFWDAVVYHHTFATGGHGYDESFDAPDRLSDEVDGRNHRSQDLRTCESCNVYNMVKFTRMLFSIDPDIQYAEFHERALFNHVLASISFSDGELCYMVPISPGVTHEYQGNGFTCCVGTGMESHALHGYGIYYEAGDKFWVNLFAPSTVESKTHGLKGVMETEFPEGEGATFKLTLDAPKEFALRVRRPAWAGEGFAVKVNGEAVAELPAAGSYVELARPWKTGDVVSLTLPKTLHKEPLPDNKNRVALMWGPLVLGADLGAAGRGGRRGGTAAGAFPVFLAESSAGVDQWLKPVAESARTFRATGVGAADTGNDTVTFKPFYELSNRRYGIYWDVYTPEEWKQRGGTADADTQRRQRLEAATVAFFQPGQMQPERDYNFQGEEATVIQGENPGRRGAKWFSCNLPVDSAHPMVLLVTYNSGETARREFTVSVDGTSLKAESVTPAAPARFYDGEYAIPVDLVRGKQKVTVRFEAVAGNEIASVYGVRMIRGDAPR